jgi:RimJ/RimL family protein N-acetyltransferase
MPGAHYWLTSDRLALRRFTPDDVDWLADLYSDPDVTRYLGWVKDRVSSAAGASRSIRRRVSLPQEMLHHHVEP